MKDDSVNPVVQEENEFEEIVSRESYLKKFMKAGLIAGSIAMAGNKSKGTKASKWLDNDYVKSGALIAGTMALSNDEDYGGDLLAASSFIYGAAKFKNMKKLALENGEEFMKLRGKFEKADDIYKTFSLMTMNVGDKVMESVVGNFSKSLNRNVIDDPNSSNVSKGFSFLTAGLKAVGKSLLEPTEAIRKKGLVEGLKHNFHASYKTRLYNEYKFTSKTGGVNFYDVVDHIDKEVNRLGLGIDFFKQEPGIGRELLEKTANKFGIENMFADASNEEIEEKFRMFKKYNKVESTTTFSSMLGTFSKYNKETGKMEADMNKILNGDNNNIGFLQSLAEKFEIEAGSKIKGYKKIDDEIKEGLFVKYLSENGFDEFVDRNYKNKKHIAIGEFGEKIKGKYTSDINSLIEGEKSLIERFGKGEINEEKFNEVMSYINKAKNNQMDGETQKLLQDFKIKGLSTKIEKDLDNEYVEGLKKYNLIKNFSLTEAIEKTDNGIIDKTSLDGSIMSWSVAGIFEKGLIGMYKSTVSLLPSFVEKNLNVWNPLKLIESDRRINDVVFNNYVKNINADNGYLTDGKFIQWNKTTDVTKMKINKKNGQHAYVEKKKHTYEFSSDEKRNHKITTLKQDIDLLDENYLVRQYNVKNGNGYRDIYSDFKKNGFKSAFERLTHSHMNPTSFRYEKPIGNNKKGNFWLANYKESYYSDDPFFSAIENNNLTANSILGFLERKGKKSRVANVVFGKKGDVNTRMLNIDNRNVEERAKFGIKLLLEENYNQYAKMAKSVEGTKSEGVAKQVSFNHKFSNAMLEELSFKILDNGYSKGLNEQEIESAKWFAEQFKNGGNVNGLKFGLSNTPFKFKNSKGEEMIYSNAWIANVEDKAKLVSRVNNAINIKTGNFDAIAENGRNFKTHIDDMTEWLYDNRFDKTKIRNNASIEYLTKLNQQIMDTFASSKGLRDLAESKGINIGYDFFNDGTVGSSSKMNAVNKFIYDVYEGQSRARVALDKNIYGDVIIKSPHHELMKKMDYSVNTKEGFEGLNDVYEAAVGFEYNKIINKNDGNINSIFKGYFDLTGETFDENSLGEDALYRFYNYANNLGKSYGIGEIERTFSKLNSNNSFNKFESYDYFNKLSKDFENTFTNFDEEIVKTSEKSLFETVEGVRNHNFDVRKRSVSSKLVVEDSIKKHMEISNILESTRKFVQDIINKGKKGYYNPSINLEDSSYMHGQGVSTGDIMMKNIIHKLQDTLQHIGVERIPGEELGGFWTDQYKNFMKYRVVPLALGMTGYIATDSLTDALVPDETPLIGNGITGVATRTVAATRVGIQYGLKYTGVLGLMRSIENAMPGSIENGLSHLFDPLMDPSEMIDVYFHGKAVRTNKNRNWFTAGRQSGSGEEFDQYRPHLLYTLGNRTAGIYDNKFEKFFRQDNLLTKYPWYILDPYKEERDAYEKFGALYPMTEQLFKDIPVFGHLMNATLGEIIKPTQFVGEEQWKVADGVMRNVDYNPNDPSSPEFISYDNPNKFIRAGFEAIEDLKTWSGLFGYSVTKGTELLFGKTNPYADKVTLDSIDNDTSYSARYERLGLGGMFGTTEGIRRLLDNGDSLGMIEMNPLKQRLPDWMPGYFSNGKNPYMKWNAGEYILPGEAFEETSNSTGNENIDKFRILSMTAPTSQAFNGLKGIISKDFDNLTQDEKNSYLEALSYADRYGKRNYIENIDYVRDTQKVELKIDKKISPYEFISGGKRYKIDSVESDFNKLSAKIGSKKATRRMDELNKSFVEKGTYTFNIANSALAVGIDNEGDFIKVSSDSISKDIKGQSIYNSQSSAMRTILTPARMIMRRIKNSAMPSHIEKLFGTKSAYNEWSQESVQAPYFRDWDSPISSFVEPIYNYSANSLTSAMMFNSYTKSTFLTSSSDMNLLGLVNKLGMAKLPINKITGTTSKSSEYNDEEIVQEELEKVKFLAGDKSYFNMTGKERMKQYKNMLQESDASFFEGLVNTQSESEREKILNEGSVILTDVLKTIWNRHQKLINESNDDKMYEIEKRKINNVLDIGYYDGNKDKARAILKAQLGVKHTKLDNKRIGIISSYRGGVSKSEGEFIRKRMYETYNSKNVNVTSTIYPKGQININRRED